MVRMMVVALAFGLLVGLASPGYTQYLFMDTSGDAASSTADCMSRSGRDTVDIWLQTDRNRDGSNIAVGAEREALSILGYELVLKAVGGTVKWGEFTNLLPEREYSFGRQESPTELQVGYFGAKPLPAGKYKIARFSVTVVSGDPGIEFATHGTVRRGGLTALGSPTPGKDGDHYLKFTADRSRLGNGVLDEPGDWADSDGLGAPNAAIEGSAAMATQQEPVLMFGVSLANAGSVPSLTVTTTREGHLRVRLYDVRGRLVDAVVDRGTAPAGIHRVDLSGRGAGSRRLASGIYFYRVEAAEGDVRGRFVLLRQ